MSEMVLVVDDDIINLKLMKAMIEKLGVQVDTVSSGAEALERIKDKKYTIVLLDHNMPGLSGYETAENIRKLDGDYYRALRIIGCTADEKKIVEHKAIRAGMDQVIYKPVSADILKSIFKNLS